MFGSFIRRLRPHTVTLTEVCSLSCSAVYGARPCAPHQRRRPHADLARQVPAAPAPGRVSGNRDPSQCPSSHRAAPALFLSGLDVPVSGKIQAVASTGLYL